MEEHIMNTVKIDCKNTKMVAHRGVSGLERENTVPAFLAACQRSYFGVETDVRPTKDGSFVLLHDNSPERVSNGAHTTPIRELDASEVFDIVLPDRDGSLVRRDIRIPSLAEYIHVCKKYEKKCVLEIKVPFTEEQIKRMIDEIDSMGYLDNVIFISFYMENCRLTRKYTDGKIQFLTMEMNDEILNSCKEYRLDLDVRKDIATSELIEKAHSLGMEINVWTVDSPEEANALIEMGVDYVTTNILE